MVIDSLSVGLVVYKVPLVDIAVGVEELAFSCDFVMSELAFIASAVGPELFSDAFSNLVHFVVTEFDFFHLTGID